MNRTPEDQSLVDFMLRSIKSKTVDEVMAMNHSALKVSLNEILRAGLQINQLNLLPDDFIKDAIAKEEISRQELIDVGIDGDKIERIAPSVTERAKEPVSETFIFDTAPKSGFDFDTINIPIENIESESILDRIRSKKATAIDVRNALVNHSISEADLINNFGYTSDMMKMIREFEPQVTYFPPLTELPPLRSGATDIYFLGMPASGKSTMLASFLYYGNRSGLLRRETDNNHGNKYANQLIMGMAQGYLPSSTPTELINYIPLSLRNPEKKDSFRNLNLIDMAGEKFRSVGAGGMREFKAIRDYLTNSNSKCLIFVMDYFKDEDAVLLMEQDQNLQEVIAQLDNAGIMEHTETIYMVVTKADLFPSDDKREFAKEYIQNNYRNFLSYCQEVKNKHKITLKSFPYSIGPSELTYLMQDRNPRTNTNLEYYPGLLTEQIIQDFPFIKKGFGIW
jgi:GTPase SAR1 family protein